MNYKIDYGKKVNYKSIVETSAEAEELMSANLADTYPGCGRNVTINRSAAGGLYLAVDHGAHTDYQVIVECADDDPDAVTPRDLGDMLIEDDADLCFRAGVHGAGEIGVADADAETCNIIAQQEWYGPNTTFCWLTESDRKWLGTYAEAADKILELEREPYCLEHNECSRPIYYIIEDF